MKLSKLALALVVCGLFTVTVLWSDPIPADLRFRAAVFNGTTPLYSLSEADTSLLVEARGWTDVEVEGRIVLETTDVKETTAYYRVVNGNWVVSTARENSTLYPDTYSAFKSGTISVPALTEVPAKDLQTFIMAACFRLKTGPAASEKCTFTSWMMRKPQTNPVVSDSVLRVASVRYSSGASLSQAVMKAPIAGQRASFDITLPYRMIPAALAFYPDLTSFDLPNTSLDGVKVSVYGLDSKGVAKKKTAFTIVNGKTQITDPYTMYPDLLKVPPALQALMDDLIKEAGIDRLTQAEKLSLLDNMARNEFFTTKLNNAKLKEAIKQNEKWSSKFLSALSVPLGNGSTAGKWMAGIWHPTETSYRVVIETEAGVKPFGLFVSFLPMDMQRISNLPPMNTALVNERELTWAAATMQEQLGPDPLVHDFSYWPTKPDELSPECRAMVESGPAKSFASGIFGAFAAGAVGRVVGGVGSAFGIPAASTTLTHAGEVMGWLSSSVFDGMDIVDAAKFQIAYYASNAFAWKISKVTATKYPNKPVYCVGKPLLVDTVWFNQCGQPIWGVGSQNSSMFGMTPADIARVELLGPVMATTIPAVVTAIDSGVGARYRITGTKPGTLNMVFKVSGTDKTQEMQINFKKCTSKELELP